MSRKKRPFRSKRPFPQLQTDRLILRELQMSDLEPFFELMRSEQVRRFSSYPVETIAEAEEHLLRRMRRFPTNSGIRWAIARHETPQLIGTCGFHNWSQSNATAEIGYDLLPAYWNFGYMSEAVKAIVGYGFTQMQLNRIEAWIIDTNVASRRVVEKSGFQLDGLMREDTVLNGRYYSTAVYSLLRQNWRSSQP